MNLFVRKFIKEIIYSKENIQINLFYAGFLDEQNTHLGMENWRAGDRRIVAGTCEPRRVGLTKEDYFENSKWFDTFKLALNLMLRTLTFSAITNIKLTATFIHFLFHFFIVTFTYSSQNIIEVPTPNS